MTDTPRTDAPEAIYLQHDPENEGGSFSDAADVTWCSDKINESDLKYLRADVAERELTAEREKMLPVWNMLLLDGEQEGRGLRGAEKLRAIIDGLITQRQRAEKAEAEREALRKDAERYRDALVVAFGILLRATTFFSGDGKRKIVQFVEDNMPPPGKTVEQVINAAIKAAKGRRSENKLTL